MSAVIELKEVSKHFSGHSILDGVSLSVETGSTVGIVGSNGSGKSVLFQTICGFLRPDSGSVWVQGEKLGEGRDFPDNVGVLINSPGFISLNTGLQNLRYLAGIRGVIGDQEIRIAMQKVGLDPGDRTKVEHYSLGMKQKLGLAQAIMEGQDILILDEKEASACHNRFCSCFTDRHIMGYDARGRAAVLQSADLLRKRRR